MGILDKLMTGASIGDWDTGGPAEAGTFQAGFYSRARAVGAHPSRVGGHINPSAVVVHTTDMRPNDFDALVKAWSTRPGPACAHFILGRTPRQGLVQMASIHRNGNHAGGPLRDGQALHGWWVDARSGRKVHPNHVAVGVEVHAAGRLSWQDPLKTIAAYTEKGKVRAEFFDDEIYVDNLGRPWHAITPYQLETLDALLRDLHPELAALNHLEPKARVAYIKDRSAWDTSYAAPVAASLVGHVSLDPIRKMDPGPQLMRFINDIAERDAWV